MLEGTSFMQVQTIVNHMEKLELLNLSIHNMSMEEVLRGLKSGIVFTPNVDHFVKLQHDPEFLEAYGWADYKLCDSKVVYYAAKFLGYPIKEKVSGSDLFPHFYHYHRDNKDIKIFLLGGWNDTAERARTRINKIVRREIIVGTYSPKLGFEADDHECRKIEDLVNRSGATVLAVGLGAPKQEKFIVKHKDNMPNIKIFMAIGATINFEAGAVARAPQWMSNTGLEWLYRLLAEPKRLWKRYLIEDPWFLWLVLLQKLNLYTPPLQNQLTVQEQESRFSDETGQPLTTCHRNN
jgi:exopolysaccharide biosynthesis WecB/TagA/CpsF family protein